MLKELRVNNYAIIDNLEIDFSPALNTITGETGAGKSILLGALELLAGARTDSSLFANNEKNCIVEAVYQVELDDEFLAKNDISCEGGELIIRRTITPAGRSRAFVNDEPVTLTLLKELSQYLVDIHSQHQSLLLAEADYQTKIVDSISGYSSKKYKELYTQLRQQQRELRKLVEQSEKNRQRADYLEFQINQIVQAEIKADEVAELEARFKILESATEIIESLGIASEFMHNEERGIVMALKNSSHAISKIKGALPQSEDIYNRLESLYIEAKDLAGEIDYIASDIEVNPSELELIRQKLDIIYDLMHKHSAESVEELLALCDRMQHELDDFVNVDSQIERLAKSIDNLESKSYEEATILSDRRRGVVVQIEKSIEETLAELGIKDAQFKVVVEELDELTPTGINSIKMLFSGNSRKAPQPIESVASGGEMSRVMLAIKGLMSQKIALPTIIFDEIDTGVSGVIAHKMGEIIEQMSRSMQVLNITHLPQVASKGDSHFMVYKDSEGTHIRRLDKEERVDYIATMLSGSTVTDAARKQAIELLKK